MKVRFKWKKSWPLLRAGRNYLTVMYQTPRMPKKGRLSRMARIIQQSSLIPPCRARGERSLVQEASARLIRKTSATRCAKTRMLESSSAWWRGPSSAVTWCPALTEVSRLSGAPQASHSTRASRPVSGSSWSRIAISRPGLSSPSHYSTLMSHYVSQESWPVGMDSACPGPCSVTMLWTVLTVVMRICVIAGMILTGLMTVTPGSAACPSALFCDDAVDCLDGSDENLCDSRNDPNRADDCDPRQCSLP